MRGNWVTILVLLGCGGLLAWRHGPTFPSPDPDDANAAVWQTLQRTVDLSTGDFSREPLKASDAFTGLSRYLNLPIAIDSDADFDFQPSFNAIIRRPDENLTARQWIDWILAESGGRGAFPVVKHGQLTIRGPRERDAVKYFVGQVHLIPADLLAISGESSQSVADLVQEIVEPDSWSDLGGKAQIRALPGALAVVHRYDVQLQIAQLIDTLARVHRHLDRFEPVSVPSPELTSTKSIQAKLDQLVTFSASNSTLRSVVDSLQAIYEIPICVDRRSLLEIGLKDNTRVTVDLKNVTLRFLLQQMLQPHTLTVDTRHGFLMITSEEAAEMEPTAWVIYPVGDLTGRHSVAEIISNLITPDAWSDVGGESVVAPFGNVVTVAQTPEAHAELADLLERWRTVRDADNVEVLGVDREIRNHESDVLDELVTTHANFEPLETWLRELLASQRLDFVVDKKDSATEFAISNAFLDQKINYDADALPLWYVLSAVLAPLDLVIIPGNGRTLVLTSAVEAQKLLSVYNVEALVGPGHDADRQDALRSLIVESIAPDTWSDVGGEGEIEISENVLMVRQNPWTQRALESLLGLLIQVPDQPSTIGVLADQLEPRFTRDSDDLQSDLLVTRVYCLPKSQPWAPSQPALATSASKQLLDEIYNHVAPYSWSDVGGDASAVLYNIDERETMVISQTLEGHQDIVHFLDAIQIVDGDSNSPIHSATWHVAALPGDKRTPLATLSYRSVDAEFGLLERWGWISSEEFHEFLELQGKDRSEVSDDDPRPHRLYLRQKKLLVIADSEASCEVARRAVDSLLLTLHQVSEKATVSSGSDTSQRSECLMEIMLDDPDETRRLAAAFLLRIMSTSPLRLTDAALDRIRRHLEIVEDPVTCKAILVLLAANKESSEPVFSQLLETIPRLMPFLQQEAIEQLGNAGPAAVPYLCRLTHDETRTRLKSPWFETLAIRQLVQAAGKSHEASIRTILEVHTFASSDVQKDIAEILPKIDPPMKITRKLIDEFSRRSDASFQQHWVPFREMIVVKIGDPE